MPTKLTPTQTVDRILAALPGNPDAALSAKDVATAAEVPYSTATQYLRSLATEGKTASVKTTKGAVWHRPALVRGKGADPATRARATVEAAVAAVRDRRKPAARRKTNPAPVETPVAASDTATVKPSRAKPAKAVSGKPAARKTTPRKSAGTAEVESALEGTRRRARAAKTAPPAMARGTRAHKAAAAKTAPAAAPAERETFPTDDAVWVGVYRRGVAYHRTPQSDAKTDCDKPTDRGRFFPSAAVAVAALDAIRCTKCYPHRPFKPGELRDAVKAYLDGLPAGADASPLEIANAVDADTGPVQSNLYRMVTASTVVATQDKPLRYARAAQ